MAQAPLDDVTAFFFDGDANAALHKRVSALYFDDPVVRANSKLDAVFLDRPRRYARAMRLAQRMLQLQQAHGLDDAAMTALKLASNEAMPVTVHDSVYAAALRTWAASLQAAFSAPSAAASTWSLLGCYAQTELGHGSNVRGIETSATYLPDSDEFEVHTPSPAAVKWWVGGLGRTATHAIVIARLILPEGGDRGPHAFHIRIRDARHMPLPGMSMGDIGPKLAFEAVDNGYLYFNRVRVPASALISVTGSVARTRSGAGWSVVYSPPSHPQAAYSGLVAARVGVVSNAYWCLAHAAVIVTRYSAARVQFSPTRGAPELPVLHYFTQRARVLPVLAAAVMFSALGTALRASASDAFAAAAEGTLRALNDLHITSSAVKVYVTEATSHALETARRCAGGHGYSHASGLPALSAMFVHLVTAEGDNYVLSAAVARHLMAAAGDATLVAFHAVTGVEQEAPCSSEHAHGVLEDTLCSVSSLSLPSSIAVATAAGQCICHALAHVVTRMHSTAHVAAREGVDAVQSMGLQAYDATMLLGCSYSMLSTAAAMQRFIAARACTTGGQDALAALLCVHVISTLRSVRCHSVTYAAWPSDDLLSRAMYMACERLAPMSVACVDALCIHDDALGSLLGRKDGLRYDDLLAWAQREPMNAADAAGRVESDAAISDIMRMGRMQMEHASTTRARL